MGSWGATVNIVNSVFSSISNCGSIIRNFYSYFDENLSAMPSYMSAYLTTDIQKRFIRQLKENKQEYEESSIFSPMTCSTTAGD